MRAHVYMIISSYTQNNDCIQLDIVKTNIYFTKIMYLIYFFITSRNSLSICAPFSNICTLIIVKHLNAKHFWQHRGQK